jgi:hypothetical protein
MSELFVGIMFVGSWVFFAAITEPPWVGAFLIGLASCGGLYGLANHVDASAWQAWGGIMLLGVVILIGQYKYGR